MKKILLLSILLVSFLIFFDKVSAFGECDQYGYMAIYNSLSHTCSCPSGYSFGKDILGKTSCISDDQLCKDQYGYNARSDYLTGNCKCNYGYGFSKNSIGKIQCINLDSICYDKLGYGSSYDSLSDSCKCDYNYFIKNGECAYGPSYCRTNYGLHSSYNNSATKCECDNGYTLNDSNQCVEKQNNVYFTLKELDTDNKKAIIKSDYDYRYYLITYNTGCYSFSFKRYLNHQIVVNLGTDFDLDTWDKIVLQDDDETCDITHKEYADSSTTLEPDDEEVYYYISEIKTPNKNTTTNTTTLNKKEITKDFVLEDSQILLLNNIGKLKSSASFRKCPSTTCSLIRYYTETSELKITGSTLNGDWYRIDGTTKANGQGQKITGWISSSLFSNIFKNNNETVSATTETRNEHVGWFKKFLNLFK